MPSRRSLRVLTGLTPGVLDTPPGTSFRPLDIRRRLGKEFWQIPTPFGPDGWIFDMNTVELTGRIIISCGPSGPDETDEWFHASISYPDHLPEYAELAALHHAVWPDGYAYQVFAPPADHVNIHPYALHLWGKPDGSPLLPNFGSRGTI